ncbi:MAG TPA: glycoside hydrolase family 31 protein [Prolixibacteraceae bacterium]|nr:glycoside hydrolase family 31 protein [Prolixibacteraceae bacterium]
MKNTAIIFVVWISSVLFSCQSPVIDKESDRVSIRIKETGETIRLIPYTDLIVRVSVSKPGQPLVETESLIADMKPDTSLVWELDPYDDRVVLSTAKLRVTVSTRTGEIEFTDPDGSVLLQEELGGGRYYGNEIDESAKENAFQQVFESPADEAFYGLGQHQNGEVNYKGLDVELMQHNIVAVVPFVYSSKNYGILWDNYSITRFGDPRDYQPIGSLNLYDADGNPGGLTARYFDAPDHLFVQKTEDTLAYNTLDDLRKFPEGFRMSPESKVEWEGYLEPKIEGQHKFKLYVAGYWKVWVDGTLIIDKWRQVWNPWYNKFYIDLKKGEKTHLKMEWKPDAGVSYLGLTVQDPGYADKQNKLSLCSEAGKQIDYYFIKGNDASEVISGYRDLTGKAPIVPKWAMGLWQSRERYRNQEQLLGVVQEYRKRNIPFDNIVLDWQYWPEDQWGDHDFDKQYWPDPDKMICDIHNMNAHIMISVWPKFYMGTQNFKRFEENGWLFMKNVELGHRDWVGPGYLSTFYDAYNPEARKAFWEGLDEKLFSKGIDAWWLDATEPDIHSNVTLDERKSTLTPNYFGTGEEFFNSYSLLQAKGVYEGQRSSNPDKRVFILTRSAFAGQQRYAAATWSGDIVSRWDDLRDQIAAGINMGLSGIPYWTTDIGGFSVERRYEHPTPADLKEWRELNTRWYQFGVFCPLFRIHGQFPLREIYNLAPENSVEYQSMVYFDRLRYRLMPYIYSWAAAAWHENAVIMRGLVMDYAYDRNVHNINDQFLFGKAFMVCPIGSCGQRERKVYLPSDKGWYDFYTGRFYTGGQSLTVEAPLDRIPLFVPAGSILPVGPEIQYALQPSGGKLNLMVYTGDDASFTLYEDEGTNYNYEMGIFSQIELVYNEKEKTLTLGERMGSFPGMDLNREIRVFVFNSEKPAPFHTDRKPDFVFEYDGKQQVIRLR